MKSYRNAIAVLALTFVFSASAFAGDGVLWTGKTPPPPPPQADGVLWTGRITTQADGIIHTDVAAPAPETDALTQIALALVQTLIPLL
jgi:hypothetical protein